MMALSRLCTLHSLFILFVAFAYASIECPSGEKPVNCLIDPCVAANCGFECERDYCGGCFAHCLCQEDSHCTSTQHCATRTEALGICKDKPAPDLCPDGSQPVNCFVNPCSVVDCFRGTCVTDYCGGCHARCTCESNEDCPKGAICTKDPRGFAYCEHASIAV